MEDELRAGLRESYGRKARERDLSAVKPWKAEERLRFLALLQEEEEEERRTLLELGAGPGKTASSSGTTASTCSARTCRPRWPRCARARASRRA